MKTMIKSFICHCSPFLLLPAKPIKVGVVRFHAVARLVLEYLSALAILCIWYLLLMLGHVVPVLIALRVTHQIVRLSLICGRCTK